jgi:hypothetical protein
MVDRQAFSNAAERYRAAVFLSAGGLLLIAGIINGIDVFTSIETQHGVLLWLEGLTGFGGVVLSFVGILGLYPDLLDTTPRMARTGVLLAVGPTAFFTFVVVSCSVLAPLVGFPSLKTLVPSFVTIIGVTLLLFSVAITIFGVASFRTAVPSRAVGGALLVVAITWFAFFGATWAYAPNTPVWITFVQSVVMGLPLVFNGYRLRTDAESTEHRATSTVPTG